MKKSYYIYNKKLKQTRIFLPFNKMKTEQNHPFSILIQNFREERDKEVWFDSLTQAIFFWEEEDNFNYLDYLSASIFEHSMLEVGRNWEEFLQEMKEEWNSTQGGCQFETTEGLETILLKIISKANSLFIEE